MLPIARSAAAFLGWRNSACLQLRRRHRLNALQLSRNTAEDCQYLCNRKTVLTNACMSGKVCVNSGFTRIDIVYRLLAREQQNAKCYHRSHNLPNRTKEAEKVYAGRHVSDLSLYSTHKYTMLPSDNM